MTNIQRDLLIHFISKIRRMGLINEKVMAIEKSLHFSFYEKH